jgi:hypothetical protein
MCNESRETEVVSVLTQRHLTIWQLMNQIIFNFKVNTLIRRCKMKKNLSRLFNTLPKRILAGSLATLIFAVPVAVIAANSVNIGATSGIANISAGNTSFASSVSATYNQTVEVEVIYTNSNAASSGLVANDVHVKINIPSTAGTNQVITTDVTGTNTNDVTGNLTATLNDANEYLEYIPGTTTAKVTNTNGTTSTYNVPDSQSPITNINSAGYVVNNGNPCNAAAVTAEAVVVQPGVKIVKQVELASQTNAYVTNNTADPGDTLKYLISYTNTGNTVQDQVIIRDNLPPGETLVPNTTMIADASNPNGVADTTNDVTLGGLNLGDFGAGANAYVEFQVTLPSASSMACGTVTYTNVGVVHPQGMDEFYNTANTVVSNPCTPTQATYSCNGLTITQNGNAITASVSTTQNNGATLSSVSYNFGDGSTPLTSNQSSVNYTYATPTQATTDTVTAQANFSVNGKTVTLGSPNCTKTVSLVVPTTPTTPSTPSALVNTGPGDVLGIFAATSIVGAVGHRLFRARQFARNSK